MIAINAYQIKITLLDSDPAIWRRVLIPEKITFLRLHDVIQFSMGWRDWHLHEFDIKEEKLLVTFNDEAIYEYEHFSKMDISKINDPCGFIANLIEKKVKYSGSVKIDRYLKKYKKLNYMYDFGDSWEHEIVLEDIVEDYENVYPVCIGGENPCPPEDAGGIHGYENFLAVINDQTHPDHEFFKNWAEDQYYEYEFDIEKVNRLMKECLKLKRIKKPKE